MNKKLFIEFIKPKNIADLMDILIFICIIYLIFRTIFINPLLTGRIINTSIIAYLLSYLLTSRILFKRGLGYQRIFHSLSVLVCGIWLFELFFHYGFPNSIFINDLKHIDVSGSSDGTFPLIWSLIMISMVLTSQQYIKINKYFILITIFTGISFYLWINTGYPQFGEPQWFPALTPLINIIPNSYSGAPTLEARHTISTIGLIFNATTKILTCLIPASLFFRNNKNI
jgi:hypothetical protein